LYNSTLLVHNDHDDDSDEDNNNNTDSDGKRMEVVNLYSQE
jgi:hypothetical protein